MRKSGEHAACACLIFLMLAAAPSAQSQEAATVPSLGEIARKLKAERAQEKHPPGPLYTNDNLPSQESLGIVTVNLEGPKKPPMTAPGKNVPPAEVHDEKYFREKADKIRSQMDLHERQLALLRQQLGMARLQYYPNPQKTLEQESTPAFRRELEKLRAKIAATEKALDDDHKAIDDLRQELRRAGGRPGWIRQ